MSEKRMDGGQNSAENRAARKMYREWWEGLSDEEKERAPVPEKEEDVSGMDGNWVFEVDESILTVNKRHWVDEEAKFEGEKDEAAAEPQRMYTEDEVQEVVRRVVMAMQMSENPDVLFQARCILIAFGIGDPPTESELARLKGCSRQFVSKKVKRIQQLFNLTPSQYMRSEVACKAYSKAYWANKKKEMEDGEDE
jgi:hypothetical protein